MRDAAVTAEIIESLSRESGVSVATVRKFFERGTCACSVATNRAICEAAVRLGIQLELVEEVPALPEEKIDVRSNQKPQSRETPRRDRERHS